MVAFVYKWTHLPTLNWYVGVRTKNGCHPEDGYICSSKLVKPLILSHPEEWERTIVATGLPEEMIELETEILHCVDARNDQRSYNKHNGDGNFTVTGKPKSKEHKAKLREWNLGRKMSIEARAKMSKVRTGKIHKLVTCPHCGKVGGDNNMYRYHFEKCKTLGNRKAQ
ncbi:Nuclease associated modular domain 3 [uncultured Caudovirales phage]|uniref:Nuclease associated modular domain 3 n=1 Tax=uncultured Caudovirales phage TaxID=2100421 RepID=A0A6J5KYJ3_9CAUD|nr:Nuclease associated modular domain 3 [uncultured Caudovirales phage]CAB5212320.1 Nuclease associated modular domain 3 [uncultured Caudovirales phage]